MAWVKLEPRFRQHPKTLAVSIRAAWLHVCALCYATEYLTDGVIPLNAIPTLDRRLRDANRLVTELEGSGLWTRTADGYLIHDYLVYNLSAAEVKEMEEKKSAAGRLGGERSVAARQKRYGTAQPKREAVSEARASKAPKRTPKQVLQKSVVGPPKHTEANLEASPVRRSLKKDSSPPTSPTGEPPPASADDPVGAGSLSRPEDGEDGEERDRSCSACGDQWLGGPKCPTCSRPAPVKPVSPPGDPSRITPEDVAAILPSGADGP